MMMRIDYSNNNVINTTAVNFHDYILNDLCYDYQSRVLTMRLSHPSSTHHAELKFCNVLGVEITACDFWGVSPHVFDWISIDACNQTLIPRLRKEQEEKKYRFSNLKSSSDYLETVLITSSGNRFLIACEYILTENVHSCEK